jgi:hypothetical protein
VTWPEPAQTDESEDRWLGLCWKTRTLVDSAAGHPFAWVDDEITGADRELGVQASSRTRAAPLGRGTPGLADQDFAALTAWLREIA